MGRNQEAVPLGGNPGDDRGMDADRVSRHSHSPAGIAGVGLTAVSLFLPLRFPSLPVPLLDGGLIVGGLMMAWGLQPLAVRLTSRLRRTRMGTLVLVVLGLALLFVGGYFVWQGGVGLFHSKAASLKSAQSPATYGVLPPSTADKPNADGVVGARATDRPPAPTRAAELPAGGKGGEVVLRDGSRVTGGDGGGAGGGLFANGGRGGDGGGASLIRSGEIADAQGGKGAKGGSTSNFRPSDHLPEPLASRQRAFERLTDEYVREHQDEAADFAGYGRFPPVDWLNARLERDRLPWRVRQVSDRQIEIYPAP